mmetsp:Transcript_37211/g.81008  ORF Transcript_37211/g.81008 Transcript_37211/m.81008 type:complete len:505 (+) Transcript_37211:110-1624(+)
MNVSSAAAGFPISPDQLPSLPYPPYTPQQRSATASLFRPRSARPINSNPSKVVSCGSCCFGSPMPLSASPFVTDPSSKYRASLTQSNFYAKVVDVHGVPVVGSDAVSDAALLEAALTLAKLSSLQPQLLSILADEGVHVAVIGRREDLTDIPAYSVLREDRNTNWDLFRGLGATAELPVNGCAEENLLCLANDAYEDENICVHELAHTLAGSGKKLPTTRTIDFGEQLGGVMELNERIRQVYWEAKRSYLWGNTYAVTNYEELWAEGVQSYYSVNYPHSPPDGDGTHNHIWHRSVLEDYQPQLADVIGKVLPSGIEFGCPRTSMDRCDCDALRQICNKAAGADVADSEPDLTDGPSDRPTSSPTKFPTRLPTSPVPTHLPSLSPITPVPTESPTTEVPTPRPSSSPITSDPTRIPTSNGPTPSPSYSPGVPASAETENTGAVAPPPPTSYPTASSSTYPPTDEVWLGLSMRDSEGASDPSSATSRRRIMFATHAITLLLLYAMS